MKLSLRYKAAILIALTESILLGLLLLSNLYSSSKNMEEQLVIRAKSTAHLIASSATEPLLTYDIATLKSLVSGAIGKQNVNYIAILDHRDSTLVQAGEKTEPGNSVSAEQPILVAGSLFGSVKLQISRQNADAALAKTTRYNVAIVILEILLVAIISLSLGWFLTRDLSKLSQGAKSIEQGDLSARVPVNSEDEIGLLASQFNSMADRLQLNVEKLETITSRFRDMADNTSDLIWEVDKDSYYRYVSKRVESLLGYTPEQMTGHSAFDFILLEDAHRLRTLFQTSKEDKRPFYGFEYRARHRNGNTVVLEANGIPILDRSNNLVGYRGVTRDITRRKEDASQLIYLSEHDALTGLIGRSNFLESLEDEIKYAARANIPLTLLFLDLDSFKMVNDSHGHLAGDSVLRVAADILAKHTDETALVARLGGDEFGILLRGVDSSDGKKLAKRILNSFQATRVTINNATIHISASIGVCSYPQDGNDSQTLLARADVAMSHAQGLGHGSYYVVQDTDRDLDAIRRTVNWRTIIREALEEDRLLLEFQPIVSVKNSGGNRKFEALVRLRDRSGTIIPAAQFVITAEQSGQIIDIDKWVLRNVIDLLSHPENIDYCISVNLSGRSLSTPGFCEYCQKLTSESDISPDNLIFEITETTVIAEMARAENFVATMKRLGYRFSLDDFGVGYSSFSYLKHLPVDQIKIDGSFVRHIDSNREDQIFVRAIVQVANELGLETVAEFVESHEALKILTDIGVDYVQGNHVGLPNTAFQHPETHQKNDNEHNQSI
ncbi:MAG: putative bifunctional diguanylate cyclase/phosphodiesterase [Acidiferrobacterales bacterium]